MINTVQDWNKLVWKLNFIERKLEMFMYEKKITQKEYREYNKIISKAWIRIFDFHPDQHPEATRIFKKHFE